MPKSPWTRPATLTFSLYHRHCLPTVTVPYATESDLSGRIETERVSFLTMSFPLSLDWLDLLETTSSTSGFKERRLKSSWLKDSQFPNGFSYDFLPHLTRPAILTWTGSRFDGVVLALAQVQVLVKALSLSSVLAWRSASTKKQRVGRFSSRNRLDFLPKQESRRFSKQSTLQAERKKECLTFPTARYESSHLNRTSSLLLGT